MLWPKVIDFEPFLCKMKALMEHIRKSGAIPWQKSCQLKTKHIS